MKSRYKRWLIDGEDYTEERLVRKYINEEENKYISQILWFNIRKDNYFLNYGKLDEHILHNLDGPAIEEYYKGCVLNCGGYYIDGI